MEGVAEGRIGSAVEDSLAHGATPEDKVKALVFTWEDACEYAGHADVKSGEVLLAFVNVGKAEYELGLSERGRFGLMVQRAYLSSVANYIAASAGMQFVPKPGFEELAEEIGFTYLTEAKARPSKKQFVFSWLYHLVVEAKTLTIEQVNYKDDLLRDHIVKTLENAGMTYARRHVPPYVWPTVTQGPRSADRTAKAFVNIDGESVQWPGEQADLTEKQPWWEELFSAIGVTGYYGFNEYVMLTHGSEEIYDKLKERLEAAVEVAHHLDAKRFPQRAPAIKAARGVREKRTGTGG